jgi:hypothetical protein
LLWVTALVALGHWLLLTGLPAAKTLDLPSAQAPNAPVMSFTVHTLAPPLPNPNPNPSAGAGAGADAGARPAAPAQAALAGPLGPATATPPATTTHSAAETNPANAATETPLQSSALADASGGVPAAYREPASMGGETGLVLAALGTDAAGASGALGAPYRFSFPEPVRVGYDVQGRSGYAYSASAEIVWRREGGNYQAALRVSKLGIPLSVWTSKGSLGPQGLAPLRFGEKKGRNSEIAAHFQRDKGIVSFSRNAPNVALQAAAQDHLSTFFQLSSMVAGEPARFTPGTAIGFQSVNAYGAQDWTFQVGALENLGLPAPAASGIRLTRDHSADYDTKVEVWLAPTLGYLPVRIRLSQTNGDFLELVARTTEIPQ